MAASAFTGSGTHGADHVRGHVGQDSQGSPNNQGTLRAVVLLLRRLDVSPVPSDTKFRARRVSAKHPTAGLTLVALFFVTCS